MIGSYIPWSGYEPFIQLCNAQTVRISTAIHVTIMYTGDQEKKERLIKWMDRMDAFTTTVRKSLIQLHLGSNLSSTEESNVENAFLKLVGKIESDSDDKSYLEQYKRELDNIMNIFRKAMNSWE